MNNTLLMFREQFGMSQTELARRLHITPATISMIESGKRPLTDRMIHNIANEFGVDETWLRTGEGEPFPLPPQEDLDFQDALMRLCADDVDPWKKKLAIAAVEAIFKLPEEFLPFVRDSLRKYNDALEEDNNEKDEG